MIIEKVFKCNLLCRGYRDIDSLTLNLAEEIKQGYHIVNIERIPDISVNTIDTEPDLIITLRKDKLHNGK